MSIIFGHFSRSQSSGLSTLVEIGFLWWISPGLCPALLLHLLVDLLIGEPGNLRECVATRDDQQSNQPGQKQDHWSPQSLCISSNSKTRSFNVNFWFIISLGPCGRFITIITINTIIMVIMIIMRENTMMACSSELVRPRESPLFRLPGHITTELCNFSTWDGDKYKYTVTNTQIQIPLHQ